MLCTSDDEAGAPSTAVLLQGFTRAAEGGFGGRGKVHVADVFMELGPLPHPRG